MCASSGLRLVLAPGVTPTHSAAQKLLSALPSPAHGDVAEFSPAASATAFEIGNAVGKRGGGELCVKCDVLVGVPQSTFADTLCASPHFTLLQPRSSWTTAARHHWGQASAASSRTRSSTSCTTPATLTLWGSFSA